MQRQGKADHWLRWVLALWLAAAVCMVWYRWNGITWFSLGDTDDNIRFAQVRAWMAGQGWYDLRQYRLAPPEGANIHWSRMVDLPIAAIIWLLKPFVGTFPAQRWGVALAPMLPMAVALWAASLSVRRLVAEKAWLLGAGLVLCGQSALFMWMPLRIDHHGWQLALLMVAIAGLADPRATRGGVTVAIATALSLAIGLELLPYFAIAGASLVLRWVWRRDEAPLLRAYGLALAMGTGLSFAVFASYANRAPVCDALSPVWLSVALVGGAVTTGLAQLRVENRLVRLGLALAAGAVLAGFYALAWPHCLGRLEGISPEVERLWLANVREAKPFYMHPWRTALPIIALPLMGLIGAALATWRAYRTPPFAAWISILLCALFACAMLCWQTRAGPSAQLLAVPGAAALGWLLLPRLVAHPNTMVRVAGSTAAMLLVSGLWMYFITRAVPAPPATGVRKQWADNSRRCPTLPALRPIAKLPPSTIFTFVDFGPRLIAVTNHRAIAGPYHRNGQAILDVHHAFRGSPETAHAIIRRRGAAYVLICPGMAESTIYMAQAKRGFYVRLARGEVPAWLTPVPLLKGNPLRLYRVIG